MIMLRLSTLLLLATATVTAQDCSSQDSTLSACLDSAGLEETECNACIVSVANNPVIKGAIGNFCPVADSAACESIVEDCTACGSCTAPAVEKGECEIDLARSTSGSNCAPVTCDDIPTAPPGTPTLPPVTIPPATAPTSPPVEGVCPSESSALRSCMSDAGASASEIASCENCIELIAEFAGPIMEDDCAEADTAACNAFENHCACAGCTMESVALGECSVDFERSASGSDCPDFSCGMSPTVTPGTPTEAPTISGSSKLTAATLHVAVMALSMAIVA